MDLDCFLILFDHCISGVKFDFCQWLHYVLKNLISLNCEEPVQPDLENSRFLCGGFTVCEVPIRTIKPSGANKYHNTIY